MYSSSFSSVCSSRYKQLINFDIQTLKKVKYLTLCLCSDEIYRYLAYIQPFIEHLLQSIYYSVSSFFEAFMYFKAIAFYCLASIIAASAFFSSFSLFILISSLLLPSFDFFALISSPPHCSLLFDCIFSRVQLNRYVSHAHGINLSIRQSCIYVLSQLTFKICQFPVVTKKNAVGHACTCCKLHGRLIEG